MHNSRFLKHTRETDRQAGRQAGRQTQRERETDRQTDRDRDRDRETERQRETETERLSEASEVYAINQHQANLEGHTRQITASLITKIQVLFTVHVTSASSFWRI